MKKLLLFLLAAAGLSVAAYVLVQRKPGRPQPLRGTPDHWPDVPRRSEPAADVEPEPAAEPEPPAKPEPVATAVPKPRKAAGPRKPAAGKSTPAKKAAPARAGGSAENGPSEPEKAVSEPTASETA